MMLQRVSTPAVLCPMLGASFQRVKLQCEKALRRIVNIQHIVVTCTLIGVLLKCRRPVVVNRRLGREQCTRSADSAFEGVAGLLLLFHCL